ncbi:MAG: outer membrane beta-barrel protein [Holosporaceae bacterium]|jgi:opacity protein-like surface antigen|nr:outer membrane beta-barrel protein [Holosporaceae bacterium]
MKKIVLLTCCVAFVPQIQADDGADDSQSPVEFYGGVSLDETISSSEYKMDFEPDVANIPGSGGVISHKKNAIKKLGGGLFFGVSGGNNYYWAAELGVTFNHFKSGRTFTDRESLELSSTECSDQQFTSLKSSYGNEYGFSLKFGKTLGKTRIYGLLGVATRKVAVQYDYNQDHAGALGVVGAPNIPIYSCKYEKRLWAFVPGIGVAHKLHDRCSVGLEYKYKFYQSADKTRNLSDELSGMTENKPRTYKVKTGQHDLSLRFIVTI